MERSITFVEIRTWTQKGPGVILLTQLCDLITVTFLTAIGSRQSLKQFKIEIVRQLERASLVKDGIEEFLIGQNTNQNKPTIIFAETQVGNRKLFFKKSADILKIKSHAT